MGVARKTITPEAALAAAEYLEGFVECISNDELAEAYDLAAQQLRLVTEPTEYAVETPAPEPA